MATLEEHVHTMDVLGSMSPQEQEEFYDAFKVIHGALRRGGSLMNDELPYLISDLLAVPLSKVKPFFELLAIIRKGKTGVKTSFPDLLDA